MADRVTLTATMMSADRGTEAKYDFDAEADIFEKRTPVQIVKAFAEHVDQVIFPDEMVDFEINGAFKNKELGVVTAIGNLIMPNGQLPFMVWISKKP